jgi:hypothetical protein
MISFCALFRMGLGLVTRAHTPVCGDSDKADSIKREVTSLEAVYYRIVVVACVLGVLVGYHSD